MSIVATETSYKANLKTLKENNIHVVRYRSLQLLVAETAGILATLYGIATVALGIYLLIVPNAHLHFVDSISSEWQIIMMVKGGLFIGGGAFLTFYLERNHRRDRTTHRLINELTNNIIRRNESLETNQYFSRGQEAFSMYRKFILVKGKKSSTLKIHKSEIRSKIDELFLNFLGYKKNIKIKSTLNSRIRQRKKGKK